MGKTKSVSLMMRCKSNYKHSAYNLGCFNRKNEKRIGNTPIRFSFFTRQRLLLFTEKLFERKPRTPAGKRREETLEEQSTSPAESIRLERKTILSLNRTFY